MLFVWWFLFIYFKNEVGLIENDLKRMLGVSDFSVAIENMPIDFTREEIEKQFNSYLKMLRTENQNLEIDEIKVVKYNEGKPFYLN
jgi:allophanate hydrolase subunit 1